MSLEDPPAGPETERFYKSDLDEDGFVINLTRL
jgi:hypothetical protein